MTTAATVNASSGPDERRNASRQLVIWASKYGIVVLLAALVLLGGVAQDGFFSRSNLLNILSQNAPLALVAIGMTFVLIAGGFDLSVGAVVSLAAIVFARLAPEVSVVTALLLALLAGLLCGLVNGLVVTVLKVNPFVATFGTTSVFAGGTLLWTGGEPFFASGEAFTLLGAGDIGPLPASVWVMIAVFLIAGFVLHKMTYGRRVFAVGGNEEASRLSGIPVQRVRLTTYLLVGLCAGLAGAMFASRLGVGQTDLAPQFALDAIAVVVVGGTSLLGGEGAMWRTVVGLLLLGVLTNLFFGWSVDPNWQLICKGLIVIAAVALDYFGRRFR